MPPFKSCAIEYLSFEFILYAVSSLMSFMFFKFEDGISFESFKCLSGTGSVSLIIGMVGAVLLNETFNSFSSDTIFLLKNQILHYYLKPLAS